MTAAREVPFDGTPPDVRFGDAIEIRGADGNWRPSTAGSAPRYDHANLAGGACCLTVAVVLPGWDHPVNWPAEDVRPATEAGG